MSMTRRGIMALAAALLLVQWAASAEVDTRSRHVWKVRAELETPHVRWARPLPDGPIKTLFITSHRANRECVELSQRLDTDIDAWVVANQEHIEVRNRYHIDRLTEWGTAERLDDLRRKLQSAYSLFIVANFKWDLIPLELRADIYEQVAGGAGIVFVMQRGGDTKYRNEIRNRPADDGGFILSGVPLELFEDRYAHPKVDGKEVPLVATYSLGAGRVVEIAWPAQASTSGPLPSLVPTAEMTRERLAVQEYYYWVAIRSALWAARRDAEARLQGWPAQALAIEQGAEDARIELRLSDIADDREIVMSTTFRDRWGNVEHEESPALRPSSGKALSVTVPALPAGRHMADCIARRNGAVLDWGTVLLDVKGPVGIEAIRIGENFKVGDSVRAEAKLAGDASRADRFRIELVDENGRIVSRKDTPLENAGDALAGEVAIARWSGPAMAARLSLFDGEVERCRHERTIYVRHDPEKDFRFMVWGWAQSGYAGRLERQALRRYGFDIFYPYHWIRGSAAGVRNAARRIARSGMLITPYAERDSSKGREGVREPCMTSAEFKATRRKDLGTVAKAAAPFGMFFWSMGDESFLDTHEVCFSPTCLHFFREFLKRYFGNVDALNTAWGMDFASWEDVTPVRRSTKAQPMGLKADVSDGEAAMWVAHRLAMDEVFLGTMKLNAQIVREHDPEAHVGMEGMYRAAPWYGYNFEKMFKPYNALVPYDSPSSRDQVEIIRSFRRPDDITGGIFGGYPGTSRDAINQGTVWHQLFHDADLAFWWYSSGVSGAIGGDLAPSWFFDRCVQPVREIRGGLGKLVRHMDRLHDRIAILYSRESVCAAGINDDFLRTKEHWDRWSVHTVSASRIAWQVALEELGLQYEYVTGDQAASLDPSEEFTILILPYTQAIPLNVAKGIRAFAEAGGTVMADVRPGVFDGLGMRLETGSLDDVFGIQRKRMADAVKSGAVRVHGAFEGLSLEADLPEVRVDGQVSAAKAKALAEADDHPAVLVSKFGRGKAVLLNFLMDDLYMRRADNVGDATVALIGEVLAWSGVKPKARIVTAGENLKGLEVVRLRRGTADLVALLRDGTLTPASAVQGKIAFEQARHTFDVRASRYLGELKEVPFNLRRGEALVLYRLPYRLSGVAIRLPAAIKQGGSGAVSVSLEGAPEKEIHHVLRIELAPSDGQVAKGMTERIIANTAVCEADVPIAWNDPPGKWRVRATDVATGTSAEAAFEVVASP